MKRRLQSFFLYTYGLVKSTGVLGLPLVRRVFEAFYLAYKRHVEAPHFKAMARHVPEGAWIVDVGANIGAFTLLAAGWVRGRGGVVAIEPEPRNLESLRRRIQAGGFAGKVEIVAGVAAEAAGIRHLETNDAHPGDHKLGSRGLEVAAVTLDQVMADAAKRPVGLIKIDVQGAELLVLRGATGLLAADRPALLVEIDERALRHFDAGTDVLLEFLAGHGYAPHRAEAPDEMMPVAEVRALAADGYGDVLFLWKGPERVQAEPSAC